MPPKYEFVPENARNFSKDEEWFRDAKGRYVLFRGVNFGSRSKMPPYLPVYPLNKEDFSMQTLHAELDSQRPFVRTMKLLGFNVVRLVVQWKALAPERETIANATYLAAVKTIVEELFKLGIYSLIDFHQDIASERYGGDGFPDWAIVNPPAPPTKVRPCTGWQARYGTVSWPPPLGAEVKSTLHAFWMDSTKNGDKVFNTRTMFASTICATAQAFKGVPGVLGYELFNEPDMIDFDEKQFEPKYLGPFYTEVINQIAAIDQEAFVFIEPRVDWTVFTPPSKIETYLPEKLPGKKTVFAFHYYDSKTALLADVFRIRDNMSEKPVLWSAAFDRILTAAKKRDLIPFLTEYGCDYDGKYAWQSPARANSRNYDRQSQAYTDLSLQQIEAKLLNSTMWVFDLYSTPDHHDNWNDEDASLLDCNRQLHDPDVVARPYPMRSSAKPDALFFDSLSKNGAALFKGAPVSDDPTVIYIPDAFQYPKGFEVYHKGGTVGWDSENHLLYWTHDVDERDHHIVISPKNGLAPNVLPPRSRDFLLGTRMVFQSS